jgi:formyltetrahydrofolate synthetase
MTFNEKLKDIKSESLTLQRDFLIVVQEIRSIASKREALTEDLLFRRDDIYEKFNKILKKHRHLINYMVDQQIDINIEYSEPENF